MTVPVLILINGLGTGGAERSTAELLPRLVDHGIAPTVVCLHRRAEGVQEHVLAGGYDVRFLQAKGTLGRTMEVHRIIAELRPALVHTAIFEADTVGRLAAVGGPPVLTSLVNISYDPARLADPQVNPLKLRAAQEIERVTARLSTHFHAISEAVKESATRALGLPGSQITVIPRGRDHERLGLASADRRRRVRQDLGLGDDTPVLLAVGRQEYQKGHIHLIEAMAAVRRRSDRAVLLLVGREGHATVQIRAAIRQFGLRDRVRELGHRDAVPDLMAASDMFIFPSLYEGLGGSLLEAMALGLPSVLTDLPAFHEVIGDSKAAIFVSVGDPVNLARGITSLLDQPGLRTAMGHRAQTRFLSTYTAERNSQRMVKLYHAVAGLNQ